MRQEVIGGAMLVLGDCREWLASAPSCFRVDCVVTDPPYGVGFAGKRTKEDTEAKGGYASYEDTPENVSDVIIPVIEQCRQKFGRVVLTPGIRNLFRYPTAEHVGSIYYPAGSGMNSWGFTCWQPILYYGKDPYGGKGSRPDSFESSESAEKNGHPCPKPIGQMRKLVARATLSGETVLDPFMGSGTTGVACVNLGRKFIGVELEPAYFEIALKRIEEASRQADMFVERPEPPKQEVMSL